MVYSSSKIKVIMFLFVAIGFVAAGWFGRNDIPFFVGYLGMAFFGIGVVVFLLQLHPDASRLVLERDSFKYRLLFKDTEIAWSQVGCFFEVTMRDGKTKRVGWQYVNSPGDASEPHGWLPDSYGMNASELAEIMNSKIPSNA
jgi:hypothetical protein